MRLMNYFHRRVPVDSLALYRAVFGALICGEALTWLPHSRELFSNDGFHIPVFSWAVAPSPGIAFALNLFLVLASFLMAIGLFTRVAMIATWLAWFYCYALDSINEKSVQTIVLVMLGFLIFSAAGNRFSLDNHLRRRRGQNELLGESSIFILRMLRFEIVNVYFFCGIAKMTYPEWVNGTTFSRLLNCRWATPIATYLSTFEFSLPARIGGMGTILFELFEGPMLLLPQTRAFAIALGVAFHTGIQLSFFIGTLGVHFIVALIFLFPEPEAVHRAVIACGNRLGQAFKPSRGKEASVS